MIPAAPIACQGLRVHTGQVASVLFGVVVYIHAATCAMGGELGLRKLGNRNVAFVDGTEPACQCWIADPRR